ncbi:MAG: hypothetical protein MUC88_03245 [Planctomycetes bacterium]|jgi:hypothetical protein|nr:hypothetical protein [Planctomycetota bacterium]
MSHLTDEQLEDILQGRGKASEHVEWCRRCRARLDEKRALAHRVRQAFSTIHAGADLADRIRARVVAAGQETRPHLLRVQARRRVWSAVAIAALVLVVVMLKSSHVETSAHVQAAQTALIGLHHANLIALDERAHDEGHHKTCECLRSRSGHGTAMPCCQRGLCVCGCQMRDFQGRLVECCTIQEPNAPSVSVVLIPEVPEALGMTRTATTTVTGQAIWRASRGPCSMASVCWGEESCCVIGQVPPEQLVALLNVFEQ